MLKDFGSDEEILIDNVDLGTRAAEFECIGKSWKHAALQRGNSCVKPYVNAVRVEI